MSYSGLSSQAQDLQNAAGQAQRPEGALIGRIHKLAEDSESFARRLDRVLQNLRGAPPPSPVVGANAAVRQSCIQDRLSQHESTNQTINEMLNEIETLIG